MKQIAIVGIGMGADTATVQAVDCIREAEVLLGAKRMVDTFAHLGKESHAVYQPELVAAAIETSGAARFAVLVSGDVGFYSGAAALYDALRAYDLRLVPGISSVSYFFAKCGLSWQDALLISCHGTERDIVSAVRRNRRTFALTGGNIPRLAEALCAAGFGLLPVLVGENLGSPEERIARATVEALRGREYAALSVLLIEHDGFDPRIRTGIPDEEFLRAQIPMTKAEVRAVCLSKLGLRPTDLCYDIGCGTGSVTVELALSAYEGHVYAIDKREAALKLTRENCTAFQIQNVTLVCGLAPEALSRLPAPDAAFIGGSSGNLDAIVEALLSKNPRVRIVITAIAIESVSAAISALEEAGRVPHVVQISAAQAQKAGELHLMQAQNPVFIVSGGFL